MISFVAAKFGRKVISKKERRLYFSMLYFSLLDWMYKITWMAMSISQTISLTIIGYEF
jgi:hypothetical protein